MTTLSLESEQRAALMEQIVRHLQMLDDRTLLRLAETVGEAAPPQAWAEQLEGSVTRRRFMLALLGGGVLATTVSTLAAWQWGMEQRTVMTARIGQLSDTVERLWGLVGLYKKLEATPLESLAVNGLDSVGALLRAVAAAAQRLRDGLQAIEAMLDQVKASLIQARQRLTWLDDGLKKLADRLHLLEDAIGRALDEVAPVSQALGAFFDWLLKLLPLGVGQKVREAMERIGDVISALPQFMEEIRLNVVISLQEEWFSDDRSKGLNVRLIEPLRTRLLEPARALLDSLANLGAAWDQEMDRPLRAAIEQRAALRREIEAYQKRHLQ